MKLAFERFIETYFPGPYGNPPGSQAKPTFGLEEMQFAWNEAARGAYEAALAASGTEPTREQIAKALERADAEYDEEQDLDYHLKCADAVFALFHGALFGKGLAKS